MFLYLCDCSRGVCVLLCRCLCSGSCFVGVCRLFVCVGDCVLVLVCVMVVVFCRVFVWLVLVFVCVGVCVIDLSLCRCLS